MSGYAIGLIASITLSGLLLLLFRHEERRNVRYGARVRVWLDYGVLRAGRICTRIFDVVGTNSVRQALHYILHFALRFILYINKRWEHGVRTMMRANKNLARTAERERTTRTKLEEVALHKIQSALTEEEKKKHKDTVLKG